MNKQKVLYYLFKCSGIISFFRAPGNYKPVILCYHRISENKLDNHISYINTHFDIMHLQKMLQNFYQDKLSNNNHPIAITMDDCYSKEFHNAFHVCQKHKVHCTYFVPTGYSMNGLCIWPVRLISFLQNLELPAFFTDFDGNPVQIDNPESKVDFEKKWINTFLFDNTQTRDIEAIFDRFFKINNFSDHGDPVISGALIKRLSSDTFTSFQSHTVTHLKLFLSGNAEREVELINSKAYLENLINEYPQYVLCYPYGAEKHIGNSDQNAQKHYNYAVTLQSGVLTKKTSPYKLPRIGIYEHDTLESIQLKITIAQIKQIFKQIRKKE